MGSDAVSGDLMPWECRGRGLSRWGRSVGFLLAAAGMALLVATCDGGGEIVEPDPLVPTTITITPGTVALDALGDTAALAVRVLDQHGAALSGATVSWSSGDLSVATVSAAGVVTAAGNGTAVVTASAGSAAGQARVSVELRVASVAIGPDSVVFDALGDTASVVAEALDANGAVIFGAAVSWSSADESVATVSDAGLVTTVDNGTSALTASVGGFEDQVRVVVEQRVASVVVGPDSLTFDALGDSASLVAEALDSKGAAIFGAAVSWSSADESVATVSDVGVVTATGNGAAAVTASAEGAEVVSAEAQVVVEQRVVSVVVGPGSLTFDALGDSARLTAEPQDANGAPVVHATVSWSSEDESVATVSAAGVVRSEGNGTAAVTASADDAEGVAGAARVAVEQRVASVVVTPGSLSFDALGDTASLVAEPQDANGVLVADAAVSWSSGDESVATASAGGLVTAAGNGTTAVTASVGDGTGEAQVAVAQRIESVVVTPNPLSFDALGDTASLAAEARDPNGAVVADAVVSWSISDQSVATVGSDGLVTSVSNGTAVVTAAAGGAAGETEVAVAQRIASVAVTPSALTLEATGDTARLVAEPLDSNGASVAGAEVSWSSDNASVATVSADGLVTAASSGTAAVTASAGGATGGAQVTVGRRIASVVVRPSSLRLGALGDTARLVAEVRDTDGAVVSGTALSWSSADESVATVSGTGLVTATGYGTIAVTASAEGARGSASVEVSTAPHPDRAALVEFYNATGGTSWHNNTNWLSNAPLDQWHGVSTDADGNVNALNLVANRLTGIISSELSSLSSLYRLRLSDNSLTGPIPPELGDLPDLRDLRLSENSLTGPIPLELGNPSGLSDLRLDGNRLTGPIPPELGSLSDLQTLNLSRNDLTGIIPGELGSLSRLDKLLIESNNLTGTIPPELGSLSSLGELRLLHNGLAGPLPRELTSLTKLHLLLLDSALCAPNTPEFVSWLDGVRWRHNVAHCFVERSAAYVTQTVPTGGGFSAPLLAGEPALLRVFVTAENPDSVGLPPVRATFYSNGAPVHTAEIPARPDIPIRSWVVESSFEATANAEIPVSVLASGLEMVVEIDPNGTLASSVDLVRRIPETGRIGLDVRTVDAFELTVIPFLVTSNPDSTLLGLTSALGPDHQLFGLTRTLLPIVDMEVTVHDPVWSSSNSAVHLVHLVKTTRVAEGGGGYWMGMLRFPAAAGGIATISGRDSFSRPVERTIAHELGHNLSLRHAPCGAPGHDRAYPYSYGRIGVWGWVPNTESFVSPAAFDVMGYCLNSIWISDYHFAKAFSHRDSTGVPIGSAMRAADEQTLLLWGGTRADGSVFLNPAFVVDAPPSLPEAGGEYRVVGEAEDGSVLFSADFEMPDVADGDGSSSFAFALPVLPSWAGALARITLTGGGGSAVLDREADEAAVLLRDPETGQVRGLLLDVPVDPEAQAEWLTPLRTDDLDVQVSRGIPAADAWRR